MNDVLQGNLTLEDLNIKLLPIENRAPYELKPFRKFNYYEERVGEFEDPAPPQAVV